MPTARRDNNPNPTSIVATPDANLVRINDASIPWYAPARTWNRSSKKRLQNLSRSVAESICRRSLLGSINTSIGAGQKAREGRCKTRLDCCSPFYDIAIDPSPLFRPTLPDIFTLMATVGNTHNPRDNPSRSSGFSLWFSFFVLWESQRLTDSYESMRVRFGSIPTPGRAPAVRQRQRSVSRKNSATLHDPFLFTSRKFANRPFCRRHRTPSVAKPVLN